MFEDEHLLEGGRCGSASHCETLSIAVASLCHQITLSQPPYTSIHLFPSSSVRFSSLGPPHSGDESAIRTTPRRLDASTDFPKSSNRLLPADLETLRRLDARPIPPRN